MRFCVCQQFFLRLRKRDVKALLAVFHAFPKVLERKRGFSRARIALDEVKVTGQQAAAQYVVQSRDAGSRSLKVKAVLRILFSHGISFKFAHGVLSTRCCSPLGIVQDARWRPVGGHYSRMGNQDAARIQSAPLLHRRWTIAHTQKFPDSRANEDRSRGVTFVCVQIPSRILSVPGLEGLSSLPDSH